MKKSRRNNFIKVINRINFPVILSVFYIIFSLTFFIYNSNLEEFTSSENAKVEQLEPQPVLSNTSKQAEIETIALSVSELDQYIVKNTLADFNNLSENKNFTQEESITENETETESTSIVEETTTVEEETTIIIEEVTTSQIEVETTSQIITTPQVKTDNGLIIEGLVAKDDLITVIIVENDMSLDDYIYYLINTYSNHETRIEMTYDNIYIMAQMCFAEAGGQPHNGKIGVCEVLLNRYDHFNHTLTLKELIYSPNQFHVVKNGSINNTPSKQCVLAAVQAILGEQPVMGSYYFLNPDLATNTWIQNNKIPSIKIGEHQFYYK